MRPTVLPLSIGDGELCSTALTTVSVPEFFRYWLQSGRITVGFLGAAQIDRFGNINTTVIGPYATPTVRLPGAGGASDMAVCCQRIFIVMPHSRRGMVERIDFVTSHRPRLTAATHRARLGIRTEGPAKVITDLCIMEPDPETKELTVTSLHPGVSKRRGRRRNRLASTVQRHADRNAGASGVGARGPADVARRDGPGAWCRMTRFTQDPGVTFGRPEQGNHPPNDSPGYRSTVLRHPKEPLIVIPHTLSELTGPVYPYGRMDVADNDLTRQHAGEPLGERIIVEGRVLDEDGRPVPQTLVEIWQANAAGRYTHRIDQHAAPLDPNFSGAGRTVTDDDGRYRFVTIRPGRVPVAQPRQRLAAGAHPLLALRHQLPDAADHADVFPRRSAAAARSDLQLDPGRSARAQRLIAGFRSGRDGA